MLSREDFEQEMTRLEHIILFGQADQAISPLQTLLRDCRSDMSLVCQVNYLFAQTYWALNSFTQAKSYITRCLAIPIKLNPVYCKAKILSADIMNANGNYAGALKVCLQLLQQSDPQEQADIFALAYVGIGSFYLLNDEQNRALTYQRYAYHFAKQSNNLEIIIKSALHLLQSLTQIKEFAESLDIISYCWNNIKDGFTDPAWIAELHHYSGMCFIETGDFSRAAEALHQSLTINTRENLLWGQTQNRMALASLYVKNNDYKQACSMLESTILLASSFDQGYLQKQICLQLRDARIAQGDFAAALAAQETYHRIEINYQSKLSKNISKLSRTQLNELDKKQELIELQVANKVLQQELNQLKALLDYQKKGFDPLTQLPDRRAFISFEPPASHPPIWGLLFSIDNLLALNASLGYEMGDQILLLCSEILQSIRPVISPESFSWFRYSGQQFILLSPETAPSNLCNIFTEAFEQLKFKTPLQFSLISAPIELHHQAVQTLINTKPCWVFITEQGASNA